MNGGVISNNKTLKYGGGIFITTAEVDTVMIMNGGSIQNNTVTGSTDGWRGGGIYVNREQGATSSTTVYIKNGIIENNIAPSDPNTFASSGAQIIDQR